MKIARRLIRSPFVLEKSKLTRLLDVTEAKLRQNDYILEKKFTLHLEGDRVIETDSLDVVFATDNSVRHRIDHLIFTGYSQAEDADPSKVPERVVSIEFDGRDLVDIEIVVRGLDSTWVNETFSAAEEQVERTLQHTFMHRISSGRFSPFSVAAATLGVLMGVTIALALETRGPFSRSRLSDSMWLTVQDLKEIEPLQADPSLINQKAGEILSRQIRNLINTQTQNQPVLGRLMHWRPLLMLTPFAIILLAVGYLALRCYPSAVFLWGDAEEWYRSILNQRKTVWLGIILALGVGILGNLFVFAIGSH